MTSAPDAGMDSFVPNAWDPVDLQRLDQWRQGDLVQHLPLGWVGPAGFDRVTNVEGPPFDGMEGGNDRGIIDPDWWCVAGVITSQTCDVVGTGPGARHPFVQVSPVMLGPAASFSNLDALRSGRVVDRYLLEPEPSSLLACGGNLVSGNAVLVADLRISMPVSKALLLDQQPLRGFTSERGALMLAGHLAAKVNRPALHEALSEAKSVVQRAFQSASAADTSWWTGVDEVRLICQPTRLDPTEATFLIVHRTRPTCATVDRWKKVTSSARKLLRSQGITLRHTLHETVYELRAVEYRNSVALDLPELYRPRDDYSSV